MKRIGLLSDTHHFLDESVFRHFESCDEIWHAGDFGSAEVAARLQAFRPLRGVFGNIDGGDVRGSYPEKLRWTCEEVRVFMTHIGGYPPKYNPAVKKELSADPAQLFICGHSHILKIMYDERLQCLHINPGAAGNQGWHKVRTLVRLVIDGSAMRDCEVIELGKRG
ncbi:MAG: metallophosphoesterase family protein [Bacteroidota bacterium]|nr:metallophosphoesterase family protein [Bacteroidota bacterium]MDP4216930.1 metallophosphoesterase family protein [Bacteroidota bacterium]MDP4248428.1 metallophosphoesterase family protein [Bacteroidota bacterium]MDP4255500.1 metallophosphoesterase family protein [Bacteroidota bacterium]MDP4257104.1 metallophosphoesterase family protein [Bacteroidota bacterium]